MVRDTFIESNVSIAENSYKKSIKCFGNIFATGNYLIFFGNCCFILCEFVIAEKA